MARRRTQQDAHWFANDSPLSTEQILQLAPSVGAVGPAARVSQRYGFIPTSNVVQYLGDHGFQCVAVKQAGARSEDRQGFQKHILQFTLDKFRGIKFGNDIGDLRIVISNAHDGGGSYTGSLGAYRHRCLNSLIVSLTFGCFRVRHHQHAAEEVLEATYRIIEDVPKLEERITRFQNVVIPFEKQTEYAQRALGLRWGKDAAPFGPEKLLLARRDADTGDNLWNVFNRVQENIVKGDVEYKITKDGVTKYRHTRAVTAPNAVLGINRDLWSLTEEYAGV